MVGPFGEKGPFYLRAEDGESHGNHLLSDFGQRKSAGGWAANAFAFFDSTIIAQNFVQNCPKVSKTVQNCPKFCKNSAFPHEGEVLERKARYFLLWTIKSADGWAAGTSLCFLTVPL